jgi:hypothetical protein
LYYCLQRHGRAPTIRSAQVITTISALGNGSAGARDVVALGFGPCLLMLAQLLAQLMAGSSTGAGSTATETSLKSKRLIFAPYVCFDGLRFRMPLIFGFRL